MKLTPRWSQVCAFLPPIALLAFCAIGEWNPALQLSSMLLVPSLLLIVISIAISCPIWTTFISTFIAWFDLSFVVPDHLPTHFSQQELAGRYIAWFVLMFGTAILIQFLRERVRHNLQQQALAHEDARQRLQASEARSQGLIKFAYDAFIGMDAHGRILEWNQQAEKTFGWRREDVVGQVLSHVIVPPKYRSAHDAGMAHYLRSGEGPVLNRRIEITALHRDGHEIPVELTVYPVQQPGGVIFGSFLHDITDRKKNEEALKKFSLDLEHKIDERTAELTRAYEQAKVANRLKDEFLATVSHEIRTPLSVILGYSELLLEDNLPAEELHTYLRIIDRNAKSQMQLITDLLDVSRIITGKMRFEHATIDLRQAVHDALESVKVAAAAKAITIQTDIDATSTPLSIQGDASRIQQVLWNLLTNAVKFTPNGGRVRVTLTNDGFNAKILVADSGKGIDPEFLPYVFERFRQEDAATTRTHGGLGLGLAIVRHIVEAHGGVCTVTSDGPHQGATFSIEIPLATKENCTVVNDAVPSALEGLVFRALNGRYVLIVDDQTDNRTMLKLWLMRSHAKVREADSVAAALKILETDTPDLLISDISMPKEDGCDLILAVRNHARPGIRNLKAVAFTAHASQSDRQRVLNAGFDRHIARPVLAEILLAQVENVLSSPSTHETQTP